MEESNSSVCSTCAVFSTNKYHYVRQYIYHSHCIQHTENVSVTAIKLT